MRRSRRMNHTDVRHMRSTAGVRQWAVSNSKMFWMMHDTDTFDYMQSNHHDRHNDQSILARVREFP